MPDINLKFPTVPGLDAIIAVLEFAKVMRETQSQGTRDFWDHMGAEAAQNVRDLLIEAKIWKPLKPLTPL